MILTESNCRCVVWVPLGDTYWTCKKLTSLWKNSAVPSLPQTGCWATQQPLSPYLYFDPPPQLLTTSFWPPCPEEASSEPESMHGEQSTHQPGAVHSYHNRTSISNMCLHANHMLSCFSPEVNPFNVPPVNKRAINYLERWEKGWFTEWFWSRVSLWRRLWLGRFWLRERLHSYSSMSQDAVVTTIHRVR